VPTRRPALPARGDSMATTLTPFTYLHSTPGRMRIRVPDRRGDERFSHQIERELIRTPGITRVQSNPLTGSVLILFDPLRVDDRQILDDLGRMGLVGDVISPAAHDVPAATPAAALTEISARIGVAVGKELVKAVLAQTVSNPVLGLMLALV
jgi:copper chaperone CopZ